MLAEEVIIADTFFDVPSDNYDEFDQEINSEKLGASLLQINTLKGTSRQYQFYASRYLLLRFIENKKSNENKFLVNLASLCSEPEHIKIVVWKWLYGALFSVALMGLCIFLFLTERIETEYCLVAGTISLTTTMIFILCFIYFMRDEYVFKSNYARASLFLLENKKPGQREFDSFFVKLQRSIDKAQTSLSVSDRLVGELKMCRRLRDEGIINDQAYTAARTIIFKHDQYKA